jgi:hypothetical protein
MDKFELDEDQKALLRRERRNSIKNRAIEDLQIAGHTIACLQDFVDPFELPALARVLAALQEVSIVVRSI